MLVFGLDENYGQVKMMRYLNLQWKRRYYEPGSFEMQILMDDYDPSVKYLMTPERPELAMVQKAKTSESVKGKFVMLSGLFAEGMLKRDVFFYRYLSSGLLSNMARAIVDIYAYNIPALDIIYDGDKGTSVECDYHGDELCGKLFDLLKTQEYSQSIRLDAATKRLQYRIWQGLDRTQAQNTNTYAMFSDSCMSAGTFGLTEDDSGWKNFAIIRQSSDGATALPALTVDQRPTQTEPRRILYIDKSGTDETADALTQDAKEQLAQHAYVREVEIDVAQSGLVYLTDYDLGDKCDLVHSKMGKSYEARVTQIDEVWKAGKHEVKCKFGEQSPTEYQRISRQLRIMKGQR